MAGVDWLDTAGIYEGGTRQQAFILSLSGSERTASTVHILFHTGAKEAGTLLRERRCGMMELLSTAPDILSISQDHVPEHLKGRALIFYIKEQDRVILAGWGENAVLLGNLIRKYLEIPAGNYGMVKEALQELDLPGIVLEIYRVLDRIYQEWRNLKTKF